MSEFTTKMRTVRRRKVVASHAGALCLAIALSGCVGQAAAPTPTPDALSASESAALTSQHLDELWATVGLPDSERPDIDVIRVIKHTQWAETIAQCMTDAGLTNVSAEDGGLVSSGIAEDQMTAYALGRYVCEAQFPVNPSFYNPLNESQLKYLYHYMAHTLRQCLAEEGFEIGDPPSEQHFIENYYRNGGWQPFADVPDQAKERMEQACPQIPDSIYG